MKTVLLTRVKDDTKETQGVLSCEEFKCDTVELPWKGNQNSISCIPKGNYVCKYTRSGRLSQVSGHDYFTYEVFNVPNRAGIRIHSANYFHQLLGCIALGNKTSDIDKDGEDDIANSKITIEAFEKFMNKEPFILKIQ